MIGFRAGITFNKLNLNKINNVTMNRHDIETVLYSGKMDFDAVDSDESSGEEDSGEEELSDFEETFAAEFGEISRDFERIPDLNKSDLKREIKKLFISNNVRDQSFREEVKKLFSKPMKISKN